MSRLTDYYGSDLFDGFDGLSISKGELAVIRKLRQISIDDGFEYGVAYNSYGFTEPFTSQLENKVAIPVEIYVGDEIRLYHCHTNNTCFSRDDLALLLKPEVTRVTVVTPLGVVFSVMRGNGVLPDPDEFFEFVETITAEVDIDLTEHRDFHEWSIVRRHHEAVKEEAYQIARHFKWIIEGGML